MGNDACVSLELCALRESMTWWVATWSANEELVIFPCAIWEPESSCPTILPSALQVRWLLQCLFVGPKGFRSWSACVVGEPLPSSFKVPVVNENILDLLNVKTRHTKMAVS